MVIDEKGQITRLHKGECAFIRKDFSVQMTKQAWNGEQFKAIFLMFTMKFLRDFYSKLDRNTLPKDAKRDQISLYKLPSNRPDIVSLFESMTPYFNSKIQPTEQLLQLKMVEGVYVLLNTDKNLYASIFDFTDPWKKSPTIRDAVSPHLNVISRNVALSRPGNGSSDAALKPHMG